MSRNKTRTRAQWELMRSKAQAAAQELQQTEAGTAALKDLYAMFTNRRGVSNLDLVAKEKFLVVFEAFNAGLRDGIC